VRLGRFDRDADALARRIESHERFGSRDLNAWIVQHLAPAPGHRVLDLGCGTGRQTIPLARIVGPTGSVVALDVSSTALAALEQEAVAQGLADRVRPVDVALDDLEPHFDREAFDRVVSSYALYYAEDAPTLFDAIGGVLRPGGVLFFCGPAADNNRELRKFLRAVGHDTADAPTPAARFMEDAPAWLDGRFSGVSRVAFENPLVFTDPADLLAYWRSHNLFDESLAPAVGAAAERHFRGSSTFVTTKHAIGLRAVR